MQHPDAAEALATDASQQLVFAAPKELPLVGPVEVSRVATPETPDVAVPPVSSSNSSPAAMHKVQANSSTEFEQAVKVSHIVSLMHIHIHKTCMRALAHTHTHHPSIHSLAVFALQGLSGTGQKPKFV